MPFPNPQRPGPVQSNLQIPPTISPRFYSASTPAAKWRGEVETGERMGADYHRVTAAEQRGHVLLGGDAPATTRPTFCLDSRQAVQDYRLFQYDCLLSATYRRSWTGGLHAASGAPLCLDCGRDIQGFQPVAQAWIRPVKITIYFWMGDVDVVDGCPAGEVVWPSPRVQSWGGLAPTPADLADFHTVGTRADLVARRLQWKEVNSQLRQAQLQQQTAARDVATIEQRSITLQQMREANEGCFATCVLH